jgi:hypothetical protein
MLPDNAAAMAKASLEQDPRGMTDGGRRATADRITRDILASERAAGLRIASSPFADFLGGARVRASYADHVLWRRCLSMLLRKC